MMLAPQNPGWTSKGDSLAGHSAAEVGCICAAVQPEAEQQLFRLWRPRFCHRAAVDECLWLKKHLCPAGRTQSRAP